MSKLNKKQITEEFIAVAEKKGVIRPCRKEPLENIIFPKWSDTGLFGMMFRQMVKTKEQPEGYLYPEAVFQTVLRILRGKVLMSERPDCYCWKQSKLIDLQDQIKAVGANSAEGLINLGKILGEIQDEQEKRLVADMFASLNKDLMLVHTPAEQRVCVEVTDDLGITEIVDEWMDPNAEGMADATKLNIGDFVILSKNGIYCIRRDEFLETHTLL